MGRLHTMHNVVDYEAARKAWQKRKGAFDMAKKSVIVGIGSDPRLKDANAEKIVGITLASLHFNRRHFTLTGSLVAWPSLELLVAETGLHRDTVRKAIRRLEKLGHLETIIFGSGRQSNRYRAMLRGGPQTPQHLKEGKVIDLSEEKASRQSDTSRHERAIGRAGGNRTLS
jgi:hypothetical protein